MRGFQWSAEVEASLNVVDGSTGSKVLISSRVRNVLAGSDVVEVGTPSEEEAVHMLLMAAGLPDDAARPPEANKIVRWCNFLPLALSITGKMLNGQVRSPGTPNQHTSLGAV